nr:allergen [Cryptococcus depauperatus CBS 7841]
MSTVAQGVKEFFKSSHKPDSTEARIVCTEHAPEVVEEHVRPQEHTEVAEAIDRERHVHHHQASIGLRHRVQPIEHKVTLDPKHVNVTAPAVVREHKEEMLPEHQETLQKQRTLHSNQKTTGDVEKSNAHVGTHVNTHEHHHIHETIQPVIQRETVQPTVVHHTAAIHERVHDAPTVHEATTLPAITHDEFLKFKNGHKGTTHNDKTHSHQFFEGAPRVGGHHGIGGKADNTVHGNINNQTQTV